MVNPAPTKGNEMRPEAALISRRWRDMSDRKQIPRPAEASRTQKARRTPPHNGSFPRRRLQSARKGPKCGPGRLPEFVSSHLKPIREARADVVSIPIENSPLYRLKIPHP